MLERPSQTKFSPLWLAMKSGDNFESARETLYLDKEVCVTGKVSLYKDRPQIFIYQKEQLQLF